MNKRSYEQFNETVYTKTLPNGLPVTLLPKREMSKTFAIFTTNYGSIDRSFTPMNETEQVTVPDGIAHFLEHKLFEKEDRDVFEDFGKLGASPNAYTSFTKTAYLFSATNYIEENVKILLDFVQSPYFSDESVEKEKGIIEQEIKMYDDEVDWRSYMGTIEAMFKHHPVNIDIAGTVSSINEITKEDLYLCYETFYHPSNMTLFIIGNFDPDSMMAVIEENQKQKSFIQTGEIKRFYPEEPVEVAMKEHQFTMQVSIPRLTVGIKESQAPLMGDEYLIRNLLQSMVVDFYFSRSGSYYQRLYEEQLIDRSFSFNSTLEKNFGYTMIGSNTKEPEKLKEMLFEMLLETKNHRFTEEEINLMKRKRIGKMLRAMNSLEFIANEYVHHQLLNIDFFDIIPRIESLTLEDFNSFLRGWIDENRLTSCLITNK